MAARGEMTAGSISPGTRRRAFTGSGRDNGAGGHVANADLRRIADFRDVGEALTVARQRERGASLCERELRLSWCTENQFFGTSRFSSSNQFWTTTMRGGVERGPDVSAFLSITNRFPSGATS
jgi:hypothetical protein